MDQDGARQAGGPGLEHRVGVGGPVAFLAAQHRLHVLVVHLDDEDLHLVPAIRAGDPYLPRLGAVGRRAVVANQRERSGSLLCHGLP